MFVNMSRQQSSAWNENKNS